jgi:hypothetical protein
MRFAPAARGGRYRHRSGSPVRPLIAGSPSGRRLVCLTRCIRRCLTCWVRRGRSTGRGRQWTRYTCARSKGDLTGPSPVDRGKPAPKIHALCERGGLPLGVQISGQYQRPQDAQQGGRRHQTGSAARWPAPQAPIKLHADKGYDYWQCRDALRRRHIVPRIARKGVESSQRLGRYRYVIERTWTGSAGFAVWPAATSATQSTSKHSPGSPAPSSATGD